jgi:hypothetical protein
MINLIKIIIFLSVFYPSLSYSEELKICEEGVNKCQPLLHDDVRYSKCMRLMCYKYYSEAAKKDKDDSKYFFKYVEMQSTNAAGKPATEEYKPCDYGLRKCQVLESNMEFFTACVNDSCAHPYPNADPACEEGRKQCGDQADILNDCMRLTCGDAQATFETCPKAQSACGPSSKVYWQCMYRICLGPVDKYTQQAHGKRYMIIKDSSGVRKKVQVNYREPVVTSLPSWASKAPQGVDPEEWIHSMPQKFMITGNPSDYMTCIIPTALISCKASDIRSCVCSDGTYPVMTKGVPSPEYGKP